MVTLPKSLTLAEVAALKAVLEGALAESPALELDGGSVREVDVAGLQLLCAAHREALSAGGGLRFASAEAAEAVQKAAMSAGLRGGCHSHAQCPLLPVPGTGDSHA